MPAAMAITMQATDDAASITPGLRNRGVTPTWFGNSAAANASMPLATTTAAITLKPAAPFAARHAPIPNAIVKTLTAANVGAATPRTGDPTALRSLMDLQANS